MMTQVTGLDPSGKHGMFITKTGIRGCNWPARRSKHYNPHNQTHGDTKSCWRHVGDMEALKADESGNANFTQYDPRIQLQVSWGYGMFLGSIGIVYRNDSNFWRFINKSKKPIHHAIRVKNKSKNATRQKLESSTGLKRSSA